MCAWGSMRVCKKVDTQMVSGHSASAWAWSLTAHPGRVMAREQHQTTGDWNKSGPAIREIPFWEMLDDVPFTVPIKNAF